MANDSAVTINILGDASGFTKAGRNATNTMNGMGSASQKASRGMGGVGKMMGGMGGKLMLAAGGFIGIAAAIRGMVGAAKTIGAFEQSMAKVQAVTQASAEDFAMLSAEARRMGESTVFSASQAAEGLSFLGMAGFSASQATAALSDTLNLAVAGGMELARTADIMSNIMTGFGISANDSGRAADVLAQAASSANTDVEQLGQAMKFVAPFSSALGISMEETAAAIGVLGNAGIQAGLAGRGLSSVMGQMLNASSFTVKALGQVGLTAKDINPQVVGLQTALKNLQNFDVGILAKMFGAENADVVMSLLKNLNGPNGLDGLTEGMENSEGRAQEMADIMANTLPGAIKELGSAFEELILGVGEAGLSDFFKGIVKGTTELVRSINMVIQTTRSAFGSADLGAILWLSMKIAGSNFMNLILRGFEALGGLLVGALAVPVGVLWGGMKSAVMMFEAGIKGIAYFFLAKMTEAAGIVLAAANKIPGIDLDTMEANVAAMNKAAKEGMGEAGAVLKDPMKTIGDNMTGIIDPLMEVAGELLTGTDTKGLIDTSGMKDEMDDLISQHVPEMTSEALKEGAEDAGNEGAGFVPTITSDEMDANLAAEEAAAEAAKKAEADKKKAAQEAERAAKKAASEAEKAAKEQAAREKKLRGATKVDAFRSVGGGGRAFNVGQQLGLGSGTGITSLNSSPGSPLSTAARIGGDPQLSVLNSMLTELKAINQNTKASSGGGGLEIELV